MGGVKNWKSYEAITKLDVGKCGSEPPETPELEETKTKTKKMPEEASGLRPTRHYLEILVVRSDFEPHAGPALSRPHRVGTAGHNYLRLRRGNGESTANATGVDAPNICSETEGE